MVWTEYLGLRGLNLDEWFQVVKWLVRVYITLGYTGVGTMFPYPYPLTRWVKFFIH